MSRGKESSNTWTLVSLLIIFFFLFQYVEIHTIVTMGCNPLEEFWLSKDQSGLSPFTLFIIIFLLFGLWALAEIISSQIGKFEDRRVCTFICSVVLVSITAIMVAFRAQWEYFEVQTEVRSFKDITFQLVDMPEAIYVDPWHEFLKEKRCKNPDLFKNIESEEDWIKLEQEFIQGGGTFERIKVGS